MLTFTSNGPKTGSKAVAMSSETFHPALKPVNPTECSLAITIPLTRERFLAELDQPADRDFVHHFRAKKGLEKAAPEFCWKVYEEDEAVFVQAVCLEAEKLGVKVCYDVQLEDFTDLLKNFSVVTLVAHWRFVPVATQDITDAWKFHKGLLSPETPLQSLIKKRFEALDPELLRTGTTTQIDAVDLQRRIAKVIDATAAEAEAAYAQTDAYLPPDILTDELTERLTRLEIERAFPFALSPARAVEFKDAIHTVPELVQAIPDKFDGLLDLTVCNSVIPAGLIRQLRPNCLVAANRRPAELKARMYLYGLQISLLAKSTMPFLEVIKRVHTEKSVYKLRSRKRWNLFAKFFNIFRVMI